MGKQAVVVGLGFAGSVLARELAQAGYSVLAIEKRSHIGGNMFEHFRPNGVRVHLYGPHIFHTNHRNVYDYLKRFTEFYPYTHRVLGRIKGKLVPIPFNLTSLRSLFPEDKVSAFLQKAGEYFAARDRVYISELTNHPDSLVAEIGMFVLENVFVNYTAKQWGLSVSEVDDSVLNRVPVVLSEDDRYFSDVIQVMPMEGYTPIFEKMLNHPNIHVLLDSKASDHVTLDEVGGKVFLDGVPFLGPLVYTGPIDELFSYSLGTLPYRSVEMAFEDLNMDFFQGAAVVNYPNEEDFTRITEFKHLTLQNVLNHTTILREYPRTYRPGSHLQPYYPIPGEVNQDLYERYVLLSKQIPNLYLCGRLAEYKYYNMDMVILQALQLSDVIIRKDTSNTKKKV